MQELVALRNTHLTSKEDGHARDTTVRALNHQVTEGCERIVHLRLGPAGCLSYGEPSPDLSYA
jgi:hypothetical protein